MTNKVRSGASVAIKARPYIMIAPAMILLLIFSVYPMMNLVYMSFTDFNLLGTSTNFVGLTNYIDLFNKPDFKNALVNTVIYAISMVSCLVVLSVMFALFIQRRSRLNTAIQFTMFLPHIISLVSVSMVWQWIMNPSVGVLNLILNFFRMPSLQWLESSDTALASIITIAIWKSIGYFSLIMLSSLQSISRDIYEAASLDNASKTRTFFKITLPMISPQLFFILIVITMDSFKVFDSVRILTDGGPGDSTNVISYYVYQYAFSYMKIGYASAAGTVLLAILGVITIFYFKALSNKVHYQ